jgi:hypothetical protein
MGSKDPPASASPVAGTTGAHHSSYPEYQKALHYFLNFFYYSYVHTLLIMPPVSHIFSFLFFFLMVLGLWTQGLILTRQALYTWATLPSLFGVGYFLDRVSRTICLGASWVARITGMSHWCPAVSHVLNYIINLKMCSCCSACLWLCHTDRTRNSH